MRYCKSGCGKELTRQQKSYCSHPCRMVYFAGLMKEPAQRRRQAECAKKQFSSALGKRRASTMAKAMWTNGFRRQRSTQVKKQWKNAKSRAIQIKAIKEYWQNPAARQYHSDALKNYWSNPNNHEYMVKTVKAQWNGNEKLRLLHSKKAKEQLKRNKIISNTELVLHLVLHSLGIMFDHNVPVPGIGSSRKWDCVDFKNKIIFEVDGCVWHRCPIHTKNHVAWNIKRDSNRDALMGIATQLGWRYLRLWEHDFKDGMALQKIEEFINGQNYRYCA